MSQFVVREIRNNFMNTIGLMRDTIKAFDETTWRKEFTWFQVPVRVARHNIECLDFYFREAGTPFSWNTRWDKPYWETPNDQQPSQEELLAYLHDMEVLIEATFAEMQDEDLGKIYDPDEEDPWTHAQQWLYALRHTVHHQGSLAALADILNVPSGDWDSWMLRG